MATSLDHPHLIVCPLGYNALGGPQFPSLLFFTAGEEIDEGLYSPFNCEASGVLSGFASTAPVFIRYESSDLKVEVVDGRYRINICGVSATDFREDYPTKALTEAWARQAVGSHLIFGHAEGAAEKDHEAWQLGKIAAFVQSIPEDKTQDVADLLLEHRVHTHVPLEYYASSDYDGHDLGALASDRLPWDCKHKDFEASAAWLLQQYRSKVVAVSDDTLTALPLLGAWFERMPEDKHAAGLWRNLCGKTLAEIKEAKAGAHAPPSGAARTFATHGGHGKTFTVAPRASRPRDRRARLPQPQCTCGKTPGGSGPHKFGCPLRHDFR